LYAGPVTEANAAQRLVGGPDSIGGVGDWSLANGTLCAVVSDPSHESDLTPGGGALVDLGHCGRADDQFVALYSLINLARDAFVTVEVEGPAEGTYAAVLPGFVPFAFTNPILVDADGDGSWTAPGLSARR